MGRAIILNEKDLRDARARLAKFDDALLSENVLRNVVAGLPTELVAQIEIRIKAERSELADAVEAYELARETGKPTALQDRAGSDPGLSLIIARIAQGYSQKDLAWRLGLKEQQIQRYEADRYNTISLKNYQKVAAILGVSLKATVIENPSFRGLDKIIAGAPKESIKKILKHGRERGWFSEDFDEAKLRQHIAENRIHYGSPSLLRTGLNVVDHGEDILLDAWRAQVGKRAKDTISTESVKFDPFDVGWLPNFVKLSVHEDGPIRAQKELLAHGIVLIVEPQIPGLAIDGAAFLEDGVPVIGITIRRDSTDNFWFTLMHELGHVVLHYRTGLAQGFFDQFENQMTEDQEAEADQFASSMLIPEESWRRSPARISNRPEVIEKYADSLGINAAIVFGRIRKERNNYTVYSSKIGIGAVRSQFV